jgi:hypothetical protein
MHCGFDWGFFPNGLAMVTVERELFMEVED